MQGTLYGYDMSTTHRPSKIDRQMAKAKVLAGLLAEFPELATVETTRHPGVQALVVELAKHRFPEQAPRWDRPASATTWDLVRALLPVQPTEQPADPFAGLE